MRRTRPLLLCALALCACPHAGPNPRTLHYVGKDLVATYPADHRGYAAYVQAQLALALEPPDRRRALEMLTLALEYDRHEAHLWTVRGQVELELGEVDAARRSSARALGLRPDYPPALELAARVHQRPVVRR